MQLHRIDERTHHHIHRQGRFIQRGIKFFDSKQAIGEAICASRLEKIMVAVSAAIADAPSASEKLTRLAAFDKDLTNQLLQMTGILFR